MSGRTLGNFTHSRFITCEAYGGLMGCGNALTKGDNCYLSKKYITHLQCLPENTQIGALQTGGNIYVALKNPHKGNITLREMELNERFTYLQARVRSGTLDRNKHTIDLQKQLSSFALLEQDEDDLSIKDSGMVSLADDDYVSPSTITLEENNDVFEPESSIATEQKGLTLFCKLINSNHPSTDEQEIIEASMQDTKEVDALTTLLWDDDFSEGSENTIQEARKALEEYSIQKQRFALDKQWIVAGGTIELPAKRKITALAIGTAEEPHNHLLYLMCLIAHSATPKNSIVAIQKSLAESNDQWNTFLENTGEEAEGLIQLRQTLDRLILMSLAAS